MDNLRQEIEKKRNEMNRLAKKYGLSDDRVLMKSRELDRLLNEYQHEKKKHISIVYDLCDKMTYFELNGE